MGAACYISLEREIPGLDTGMEGKALSRASDALEALAKKLKVPALMEYFSAGPDEAADFLGDEVELPEGLPPKQHFSPDEGLRTVRALIDACAKTPAPVKNADLVLADLRDMERILSRAADAGVKWHLSIDF